MQPDHGLARAERQAKYSRKSAAYHRAALKAKKEGKTQEECKAAGKAVSCMQKMYDDIMWQHMHGMYIADIRCITIHTGCGAVCV